MRDNTHNTIVIAAFFLLGLFSTDALAQSVGISGASITPDAQSILEIESTSKGVLFPRMTQAQRNGISPSGGDDHGMIIYNTDTEHYNYWNQTTSSWKEIANGDDLPTATNYVENQSASAQSSSSFWVSGTGRMDGGLTVGAGATLDNNNTNTGTVAAGALAFGNASGEGIGSKRNAGGNQNGLDFYTNSTNRLSILNNGNVGVGTSAPASIFQINTTQTGNVAKLHNSALGNGSLVGHEFGKANSTNNMVEFRYNHITDGNAGNWVNLGLWGNANTLNVVGTGNVGIGTTGPAQKLEVAGNARITGLSASGNVQANGSGDLIISNDLPANDTDYIWNQNSSDQGANFRINGSSSANVYYVNHGGGNVLEVGDDAWIGDVNAANTVGITGAQNSTHGSLRLGSNAGAYIYSNATANIGIGMTTPTERLTIIGSGTDTYPVLGLRGGNGSATFNNGAQIAFGWEGSDDYQHFIHTRHNSADSNNAIDFYVSDGGTQNNTVTSGSRLTMSLVSGNVGVGTGSPTSILHVNTSQTGNVVKLINSSIAAASVIGYEFGKAESSNNIAEFRYNHVGDGSTSNYVNLGLWGTANTLAVVATGRVGIGTTAPVAKLHVSGTGAFSTNAYGYLNSGGSTGTCGSCNQDYSIRADGRIRATEFNAISDRRIKTIVDYTSTGQLLSLVNQLEVTNYEYIDKIENGRKSKEGFIAQQVEEVIPTAIQTSEDFIPSVYAMAVSSTFNSTVNELTVSTDKQHGLAINDEVKIITESGAKTATVLSVKSPAKFVVSNWEHETDNLFVYGKKVNDFRAVDYDQVFSIGIGAIQELSKENNQLKTEVETLKAQLDGLGDLKAEVEKIKDVLNIDALGSTQK